jgi:phosphatidylglycerol---prolipoprotein diacylglyceryl transferase
VHPIAFSFGDFPIYWYGVMMALGVLLGLWSSARRAPLTGISGEKIADLGPWLIVGALIGARGMFVLTYWEEFSGKPFSEVFMVRHGGLVYYGGFIGAALACVLFCRLRRQPLWKVADVLAPGIPLGCVFGRLGCLLNGCCYGRACDLPWAVRFPRDHATDGDPVHPTQIYDSLLNLGLYIVLAWLYRRKKFDGQVFAVYLICYAVTRSIVELFRGDYDATHLRAGLTPAHWISIGILTAGAVLFVMLKRSRGPKERGS